MTDHLAIDRSDRPAADSSGRPAASRRRRHWSVDEHRATWLAVPRGRTACTLTLKLLFASALAAQAPDPGWNLDGRGLQSVAEDCVGTSFYPSPDPGGDCQDYARDLYENWDPSAPGAGDADLWRFGVGADSAFFYFEFETRESWNYDLSGPDRSYNVEIDVDWTSEVDRGDYLITLFPDPSHLGSEWRPVDRAGDGRALSDRDSDDDVGGPTPLVSDYPCGNCTGYQTGFNAANGVFSRIVSRSGKNIVQLALLGEEIGSVPQIRTRAWVTQTTRLSKHDWVWHDQFAPEELADFRMDNCCDVYSASWPVASAVAPSGSYAVDVAPDGTATLDRLPSNGTAYAYAFTVTNAASVPDELDLRAYAEGGGAALSVDSITGATVTSAPDPGMARLGPLAPGASEAVSVWFGTAVTDPGSLESLFLCASSVGDTAPTAAGDSGWVVVRSIRPDVSLAKTADVGGVSPPGTPVTYTLTISNEGTAPAIEVVQVDSIPPELDYGVGSELTAFPPGVTTTVDFSADGGSTWGHTPASSGCGAPVGFDRCVTHIRVSLETALGVTPENAGTLQYLTRIR